MKKDQPEASKGRSTSKPRSGRTPDALREQAERRLSARSTLPPLQDARKVLHELEVHQIELEMQNEALRQSQATVIASQEKYADLYDFAPVGYFTFDHMGLITEVNLTGAALLGVERGQLKSKPFSLFVAAPSRDAFHRHYRGVLKAGSAGTCELQLTRKDGTSFNALVQSMPVKDPEGNPTGVRSVIGDITERKQAEETRRLLAAVQEEKERLSALINSMQDEVWFADTQKRFTLANPSALREFGLDVINGIAVEKLVESLEVYRPDGTVRPVGETPPLRALQGEVVRNQEEMIRTPRSGELRYRQVSSSPVRDQSGTIIGSVSVVRDITERKRAEQALRDSEARYQSLVEFSPDAILVHAEGKYVYVNPAGTRLFGAHSSEEVIGRDVLELIHPDHRQSMAHRIEEACGGAVTPLGEIRFLRLDGSTVDTEVTCRQVEFGGRWAIQIVVRDITARKQAEEARRQSEEFLRTTFDYASVGMAIEAPDETFVRTNPAFDSMLGYGPGELTGVRRSAITPPEDVAQNEERYRRFLASGMPSFAFEKRYLRKDGKIIWVNMNVSFIRDADGEATFNIIMAQDITERKRSEEALKKAHEELELRVQERTVELHRQAELLNLTHDAIIACDLNHRILFWNRGAEERYGWSGNEVKGKMADDLLQTVYPRPRQELEQELLLRGRWEGELTDTTKDGRKIIVASRQALRRDADGKPIAIIEINSDITEKKRIEEQLRQGQKMEAIGTLAGGIAHDFNNILAALIGFTEMSLDDVDKGSRLERNLQRVLKSGIRARELVKQILTFSRTTAKERKPLKLSTVVEETLKLLRASLPSTVDLRFMAESESGTVLADPTQVQQIVMNLCTNAVQAMEDRGLLKITLSDFNFESSRKAPVPEMEPGAYLRLSVSDTGHGMSKEVMEHLFEPFFTTKGPGRGTGLGLSVVHGIVKSHGGAISVESEPGKGSTVTVYLPRLEKKTASATDQEASVPTGNERILFIDDEELIVEMAGGLLKGLGYRVVPKTNGREALALVRLDPMQFDLVITDQTMPELTGIEVAREILSVRADMPVILCTGFSQTVDAKAAKAAGIKAFFIKPLTKNEIAKTIRKVLDESVSDGVQP